MLISPCIKRLYKQHSGAGTVTTFLNLWKIYTAEENGATAIEYALIASILGIALLPVLGNTSSGVASLYTKVQGYFDIVNGT